MAAIFTKAPGKIILFGEHAVVYGQPAIAIPVTRVNATASIVPEIQAEPGLVRIHAPDIQLNAELSTLAENHPLGSAVRLTMEWLKPEDIPSFTLQVTSTIPIASGMGSSAAIAVAIIRAVSDFLGSPLSAQDVSSLAFEVERIQHGTPSGIDNHVIAYQQPLVFQQGKPHQLLKIDQPTHWIIADSGESTPTRETVAAVRSLFDQEPEYIQPLFDSIGAIARDAKDALINGNLPRLGMLLNQNHALLKQVKVSSTRLDQLVQAALDAGAVGAKLSGGGRGGNIIALVSPEQVETVSTSLLKAGAVNIITTLLTGNEIP